MTLDNESKWNTIYNGSHSQTGETPISSILIPGVITEHTIIIYAVSSRAKPNWWLAGELIHLLKNAQPDFQGSSWRIPLNRIVLIQLPQLTTSYRLKFQVPRWHQEMALVVESYTRE